MGEVERAKGEEGDAKAEISPGGNLIGGSGLSGPCDSHLRKRKISVC